MGGFGILAGQQVLDASHQTQREGVEVERAIGTHSPLAVQPAEIRLALGVDVVIHLHGPLTGGQGSLLQRLDELVEADTCSG